MNVFDRLRTALRDIFTGRRLASAVRQHDRAANELDAVLREVLRR